MIDGVKELMQENALLSQEVAEFRLITYFTDESGGGIILEGGGYKSVVRDTESLEILGRVTRSFASL